MNRKRVEVSKCRPSVIDALCHVWYDSGVHLRHTYCVDWRDLGSISFPIWVGIVETSDSAKQLTFGHNHMVVLYEPLERALIKLNGGLVVLCKDGGGGKAQQAKAEAR